MTGMAVRGMLLGPGLEYRVSAAATFNFISLALALILGTAGLPHVLMRLQGRPGAQR